MAILWTLWCSDCQIGATDWYQGFIKRFFFVLDAFLQFRHDHRQGSGRCRETEINKQSLTDVRIRSTYLPRHTGACLKTWLWKSCIDEEENEQVCHWHTRCSFSLWRLGKQGRAGQIKRSRSPTDMPDAASPCATYPIKAVNVRCYKIYRPAGIKSK